MIEFKLNGKKLKIPSAWEELTFSQYMYVLENKTGMLGLISNFTGVDPDTLSKARVEGLELVIETLGFLKEPPKFEGVCTQVGKYKLPLNSKGQFNIQLESLAQFEDMRQVMKNVKENDAIAHIKGYANYVAIYLQKLRDGEYNHDESLKMVDEVYQMPAHEVIIAGGFFFLKLLNLLTGTRKNSLNTPQNQKKSKPVSAGYKKRSARLRRSLK